MSSDECQPTPSAIEQQRCMHLLDRMVTGTMTDDDRRCLSREALRCADEIRRLTAAIAELDRDVAALGPPTSDVALDRRIEELRQRDYHQWGPDTDDTDRRARGRIMRELYAADLGDAIRGFNTLVSVGVTSGASGVDGRPNGRSN